MKKMAYLMHVDWNWIKQRPHFLYEQLTNVCSTDLFYIEKLYSKHNPRIQNSRDIFIESEVSAIKKLPASGRCRGMQLIERIVNRSITNMLGDYKYIWVTSPLILDFINIIEFEDSILIYDCMDDFLGFYTNRNRRDIRRLAALERSLIERADVIFASSSYLREKLLSTYKGYMKVDPQVINNGISDNLIDKDMATYDMKLYNDNTKKLNFMYIGTIGDWIDFDLLLNALNKLPDIIFTMVGPVDTKIPTHPRINFMGTVPHNELPAVASSADSFIMPFVLNELIRSVDPVKMYEYIFFNRPIIAIRYDEMNKFSPFVSLYSDEVEFIEKIKDLLAGSVRRFNTDEINEFLKGNTWSERCEMVVQLIEGAST